MNRILYLLCLLLIVFPPFLNAALVSKKDTLEQKREEIENAKISYEEGDIQISTRSVDISKFPEIKITIEAYNAEGEPLEELKADHMFIFEGGKQKKVFKVEKLHVAEESPVDFIFVLDGTGTMDKVYSKIKDHIRTFSANLEKSGIDARLGLVLFTDDLERVYQPTENIEEFIGWIESIKSVGGLNPDENVLEGLEAAAKIKFRASCDKVAVLITDANFYEKGERGDGVTNQTEQSIVEMFQKNQIRLFSITPYKLSVYKGMSRRTNGNNYDINNDFSRILNNFSNQLANRFAMYYRSDQEAIPDEIEIALYDEKTQKLVKRKIPIVELGRKLIIENLLYETNDASLPPKVPELDIMAKFMIDKPNITIIVEGHTDSVGSMEINDFISKKRAESVKNYISSKGVSKSRIKTIGHGERKPIASNLTKFGRRLNRRTEIVIVSK